jgi:tetratricopeptide (TPR) repeat protein
LAQSGFLSENLNHPNRNILGTKTNPDTKIVILCDRRENSVKKTVMNGSIFAFFFLSLTLIGCSGKPDKDLLEGTPQETEAKAIPESGQGQSQPMNQDNQDVLGSDSTETIETPTGLEGVDPFAEIETTPTPPVDRTDSDVDLIDQAARDRASALVQIAQSLCDRSLYKECMPWAEDALRLDPGLPEAHLISGYANFKLLNTEEAIAEFEKTIELDPSNFEAHLYLGIIFNGKDDPNLALEYFTTAIQVADNPKDISTAFAHRALSYALLDRYDECFADFDDALYLDPDNGWALFFRSVVLEELAKRESAASKVEGIPDENRGFTK